MAEVGQLVTDPNGFITEGRFAGMHVSQLAEYANSLEEAARGGQQAPPPPEAPKPQTPADRLAAAGNGRVDQATLVTWARLEQDDETAFQAMVEDYAEYQEEINQVKKRMPPEQRVQRGFHEMLYTNIKLQRHPELRRNLYVGAAVPPAPPAEEEQDEEQPEVKPDQPPTPVVPKPAPPTKTKTPAMRSTSARTTAAPPRAEGRLRATDKVRQFCVKTGLDVNQYLKDMEARGMTQDDLDRISAPRTAQQQNRPRSIYDER